MFFIKFIIFITFSLISNYIKYLFGKIDFNKLIKNIIQQIGKYNIVFLKLLQWTCIKKNSEFFNQDIINFINDYTNKTPYTNEDIDWKLISETFNLANLHGDKLTFDSFEPINSGTISLVFKGKLNEQDIAIKILRKNIFNEISKGIQLLKSIFYLMNFFKIVNDLHVDEILKNLEPEIYAQIDFHNEISNILKFQTAFEKNKIVKIPSIYEIYTEKLNNIILMEWIDGSNINFLTEAEKDEICIFYVKYMFSSYIYKGIVHSDLHQGNILFIKDKFKEKDIWKIGLIDFGSVIQMSIEEINFSTFFIECFYNKNLEKLNNYILNNHKIIFEQNTPFENIQNLINNTTELQNKKVFFFQNTLINEEIILFLKIIKNNNCIINNNIYKIIISLIPLVYLCENLSEPGTHLKIINDIFLKLNNKFSLD